MGTQHKLFGVEDIKLAQVVHTADNDFIVCEIHRHQRGTDYKLINPSTYELCITKSITPLNEYTGTGFYYDCYNPQYISFEEVGELLTKAFDIQPSKDNLSFELIGYSEKSVALFGDTKSIKDLLLAMGGKFNPRLAYKNTKKAGWIFQRSKRTELEGVLNLNR